ncbi:MAG: hypothetical protein AAB221_11780 [Bacteroidota bacterium]
MKRITILFTCLLLSSFLFAQNNPKIGTEKGVREKLIRIKNALPDIKKNLTRKNEMWTDEYDVKFDMGNGIILFDEDDGEQSLNIRYTTSYFSGTAADFQNYYKTLTATAKEVFGKTYDYDSTNEEKKWSTSFFEKGKDIFKSRIRIYITCSWMFESLGPDIAIEVYSRLKEASKKEEGDEGGY